MTTRKQGTKKPRQEHRVSYAITRKPPAEELREDTTSYIVDAPRKQRAATDSKIADEFETTNLWRIRPALN